MPRGGHRPGAGAPKGNTNAVKHGRYSQRLTNAAFIAALLPDVEHAFNYIRRTADHKDRKAFIDVLARAKVAMQDDPELRRTIKHLIGQRIRHVFVEGHIEDVHDALFLKTKGQSTALAPTRKPKREGPRGNPGGLS